MSIIRDEYFQKKKTFTKIVPFLTARYTIVYTRRLQIPRDDCAVRVQRLSSPRVRW